MAEAQIDAPVLNVKKAKPASKKIKIEDAPSDAQCNAKAVRRPSKKAATAAVKIDKPQAVVCPFKQGFCNAITYVLRNPVPDTAIQASILSALTFAAGGN